MEVRVQGAVEMVEERLKQLQKSTLSPATSPAKEDTLQLPVAMTRQVFASEIVCPLLTLGAHAQRGLQ